MAVGRRAFNVVEGETGSMPFTCFEYSYRTGTGKSRRTHYHAVLLFRTAQVDLPRFELRRENFGDRIAKTFGGQDINFDEFPEFSKQYRLMGEYESEVRRLFNSEVIQELEYYTQLAIEGERRDLIIYWRRTRLSPESLPNIISEGLPLFRLFASQKDRIRW